MNIETVRLVNRGDIEDIANRSQAVEAFVYDQGTIKPVEEVNNSTEVQTVSQKPNY